MPDITRQDAERLVESIGIPPRPAVVLTVMDEKSKDEPDFGLIADSIARDVAIAAALLKTINSPFFSLPRKIQSIPQAVSLLGLKRLAMLVNSLALKTSVNAQGVERFWDQSSRTALLCTWLAGKMGIDRDAAHLFGLFRDAGIPLLMKKFPDYRDTLRLANAPDSPGFTVVEDQRHSVNHAVVGSILARNWKLSDVLHEAIARHHDVAMFSDPQIGHEAKALVAVAHIAGQLECRHSRNQDDSEWRHFQNAVQVWLMVSEQDFADLSAEAGSLLLESGL